MRADIQIALDMFEVRLALKVDRLCFERLRGPLHGEVHEPEEVNANSVLPHARRGSEPRNNDGVLFAMGQSHAEIRDVRLVLKSRGAWQQIHNGVLRDVLVEREKLFDRPIKADLPLAGLRSSIYALFGICADSESGKFISKTGKLSCPSRTPDAESAGGSDISWRVANAWSWSSPARA